MEKESIFVENCIAALQQSPLMVIFACFDNVRRAENGHIPLPQEGDKFLGNHAVTVYGYSREQRVFYFSNSYGKEWGENGNGTLPFDYFSKKEWVPEVVSITININPPKQA